LIILVFRGSRGGGIVVFRQYGGKVNSWMLCGHIYQSSTDRFVVGRRHQRRDYRNAIRRPDARAEVMSGQVVGSD